MSLLEVFYDLVKRLVKGFEKAGLSYAFTGALAASFYGLPRTTTDIDVVVEVVGENLRGNFVSALKAAELVVDEREIDRALSSGYKVATFEDSKTSYSVDVILSAGKFEKRKGTIAGMSAFFQTPEDLILAKLRMIKATVPRERTLKDEEDVKAILKFTKVNVEAVKMRAKRENTLSIFESLMG